jgi:signal transduction histidine kinase
LVVFVVVPTGGGLNRSASAAGIRAREASTERLELAPTTAELIERIGWLIRLRWVAVIGVVGFLEVARRVFPVHLALAQLYLSLAALAVYNLILHVIYRRLRGTAVKPNAGPTGLLGRFLLPKAIVGLGHEAEAVRAAVFANSQISIDLVLLAIVLHFGGGVENPFLPFFVFHVIVASILLSRQATFFHATLGLVLISCVAIGEYAGILRHYPLGGSWAPGAYRDPALVGAQLFVLGATLYLAAYIGSTIASHLRERERDVVLLSHELTNKANNLEAAYDRVSRMERAKSQYMRKVAHELRGPLGTIQTALKVVLDGLSGELPEKSSDMIRRAERRAGELGQLTQDLLALARARESPLAVEAEPLNLGELAAELITEMRASADGAGVSLFLDVESNLAFMHGDAAGLRQLVGNLLANAIRYTPRGGAVAVRVSRVDGQLCLDVSDTGIGIPPEDQARVFEEFFRSANARSRTAEGTGLGLAIVKAVVEQHHGSVTLHSTPGQGTRFVVRFPVSAQLFGSAQV